ncbi:baseplate J/gp47 family protein [Thermogemmatispora sp.]|uniref:baseplate J/gp47 family protein n=1 Tax=Thermogemmatispora sp. TaxID=1968838 RepID=UPI001DF0E8BE|nr:baseplate J/gp47 family protein [Thermogemmatispora sp.]MBX5448595.1 baseplate J/gp47 family protein [Thermogemmatispora sp.]
MSDEQQIIYLGPEEELTDVRQRLEKAQARRLILVVPPQTKLRSHVGWRLLHARTRELGKDVLVVSSDRQVRVVVKAAGFKVAESLTSPPSSRARPGSRPARVLQHGSSSRPATRGSTGRMRTEQQRSASAGAGERESKPVPPRAPLVSQGGWPEVEERETLSSSLGRVRESQGPFIEDLASPQHPAEAGGSARRYSQPSTEHSYDFHIEPIDASAAISPLLPSEQEEDETEDTLLEDFRTAQHIRQAAQQGSTYAASAALDRQSYTTAPLGTEESHQAEEEIFDPFSRIEDLSPSPLPEQRGAFAPVNEVEDDIPAISSRRGTLLEAEVEDLGDQGDIALPSTHFSADRWSTSGREETAEEGEDLASAVPSSEGRAYGQASASRLSGLGRESILPGPEEEGDEESEEGLPDIEALPTRALPPRPTPESPRVISGSLVRTPAGATSSRAASPGTAPRGPDEPLPGRPQSKAAPLPSAGSRVTAARAPRRPAAARGGGARGPLLFVGVLVLFLAVIVMLAYYVPSADVSFTLPARTFSQHLQFTATSTTRLNLAARTLPAQVLFFNRTAQAQGRASGQARVGVVKARGTVEFTNKSTHSLVIPTGTIVETASGIQFRTTAEPLVTPGMTYPVQVEAVNPGTSGNVPANSITVIPPESLQQIGASASELTVTNPQPTSGGGLGSVPQVTNADVNALKTQLEARLQQQMHDWLKQQLHNGDVAGQPAIQEQVNAVPAAGQIAPGGSFAATLSLQAAILVVRAADIQEAARAALNAAIAKQQHGYALVAEKPVSIGQLKSTPNNSGSSLTVAFDATGLAAPGLSDEELQSQLSGKAKDQALNDLNSLLATRLGKQAVDIQTAIAVTPSFYPWMPLLREHIHIHRNIVTVS